MLGHRFWQLATQAANASAGHIMIHALNDPPGQSPLGGLGVGPGVGLGVGAGEGDGSGSGPGGPSPGGHSSDGQIESQP